VSIGMRRPQVAAALGERPERFRKTSLSQVDTDAFDSLGIHVYYDAQDNCEYIECFRESKHLFVFGIPVLEIPAHETLMRLSVHCDLEESEAGCSYTDARAGITFWRAAPDEPRFQTLGVGAPSYFEPAA